MSSANSRQCTTLSVPGGAVGTPDSGVNSTMTLSNTAITNGRTLGRSTAWILAKITARYFGIGPATGTTLSRRESTREDRLYSGAGHRHPGQGARPGSGRYGRGQDELQPRQPCRPQAGLRPGPGRVRRVGPRRGHPGRPAGPEDPARPFAGGPVEWHTGDIVRITVEDVEGTHDRVSTTYKGLAKDAKVGDRLLVDDGKVGLVGHRGRRARTWSARSPRAARSATTRASRCPAWTSPCPRCPRRTSRTWSSRSQLGVDFVALSFVRSPGRHRPGAPGDGPGRQRAACR